MDLVYVPTRSEFANKSHLIHRIDVGSRDSHYHVTFEVSAIIIIVLTCTRHQNVRSPGTVH